MKYNISKELFESVMGFKVIEFYCKNKIQYYPSDKERVRCINWTPTLSGCEYNDFFFACKEWALKQGYELHSRSSCANSMCYLIKSLDNSASDFYEESEQQAVFDACEWIRINK